METTSFAILFPLLVVSLFYSAFVTIHFRLAAKHLRSERKAHKQAQELVLTPSKENRALVMRREFDEVLNAEVIE